MFLPPSDKEKEIVVASLVQDATLCEESKQDSNDFLIFLLIIASTDPLTLRFPKKLRCQPRVAWVAV